MAILNPMEIQQQLPEIDYPASKQDLIKYATEKGAGEHMRSLLEKLPEQEYTTINEITQAIAAIE